MVRLVRTDFNTKEESEHFYILDEDDLSQYMFSYRSLKKYGVYISKYTNDEVYSLNILSKAYLNKNQFLIHISDTEYVILFNHKTVYSAKINPNFITDDMIKSILITKHIAMLSSGGTIENIYYIISSKYKSAIENILKQNTKNEKNHVIAKSLGEIWDLVKPLNELDTFKSHSSKLIFTSLIISSSLWTMFFGLDIFFDKIFVKESLDILKQEIKIEEQLIKRQRIILNNNEEKYREMTKCLTLPEVKND